jgi:hypothetical protein
MFGAVHVHTNGQGFSRDGVSPRWQAGQILVVDILPSQDMVAMTAAPATWQAIAWAFLFNALALPDFLPNIVEINIDMDTSISMGVMGITGALMTGIVTGTTMSFLPPQSDEQHHTRCYKRKLPFCQ